MDWRRRIVVDPSLLAGKPVLRGTRLAVEFVLGLLASGWTYEQLRDHFPALTGDDVRACVAYEEERRFTGAPRRGAEAMARSTRRAGTPRAR
jgi:uncharacterized protein (DUF433 family)